MSDCKLTLTVTGANGISMFPIEAWIGLVNFIKSSGKYKACGTLETVSVEGAEATTEASIEPVCVGKDTEDGIIAHMIVREITDKWDDDKRAECIDSLQQMRVSACKFEPVHTEPRVTSVEDAEAGTPPGTELGTESVIESRLGDGQVKSKDDNSDFWRGVAHGLDVASDIVQEYFDSSHHRVGIDSSSYLEFLNERRDQPGSEAAAAEASISEYPNTFIEQEGKKAEAYLKRILAYGPVPYKAVRILADVEGISQRMLQKAANALCVSACRPQQGKYENQYCWYLPFEQPPSSKCVRD